MSQTWDIDTIVPGTTSPSADIQKIIDGFNALRSCFSGATEPASADQVAYMFWADTTTGLLKQRNAANSAWITIGTMATIYLGLLSLAGGNMTGGLNTAKTTIASATTPDIFATTVGNTIDYTGTAICTGFAAAPQAGCQRTLVCAGAAVFTAGANMLIDGVASGQNFTAAAGDKIHVIAVTTTQFCLTPAKADGSAMTANASSKVQDFRLSLTAAIPVTAADVIGAGTLYAVPYVGNGIALYNGSTWLVRSVTQFSLALVLTAGKPYDIFCYDNAGTPTLEVLAWTNDTTRATDIAYQDWVLVKAGAPTRRYLGTLYASGANTTEDSYAKRYLFNYYHRKDRPMRALESTDSWTYTTATWRQANSATANRLDYIQGVNEDPVLADVVAHLSSTTNAFRSVGIGQDSTTANSAAITGTVQAEATSGQVLQAYAQYRGYPGEGRHLLVWLEQATASGTATWYGDNGGGTLQSGITGVMKG